MAVSASFNGKRRLQPSQALVVRNGKVVMIPTGDMSVAERELYISDIEQMCSRIAGEWLFSRQVTLPHRDEEDLIDFLLMSLVQESQRYSPTIGSIRGFMVSRLRFRVTDWFRLRYRDERQIRSRLAKEGVPEDEADELIQRWRNPVSLDVDNRQALLPDDEDAIERLMSQVDDDEVEDYVHDVEHAESVLEMDVSLLSEKAQFVLANIAIPLANGESQASIRDDLNLTKTEVDEGLALLRTEIQEQSDA